MFLRLPEVQNKALFIKLFVLCGTAFSTVETYNSVSVQMLYSWLQYLTTLPRRQGHLNLHWKRPSTAAEIVIEKVYKKKGYLSIYLCLTVFLNVYHVSVLNCWACASLRVVLKLCCCDHEKVGWNPCIFGRGTLVSSGEMHNEQWEKSNVQGQLLTQAKQVFAQGERLVGRRMLFPPSKNRDP